MGDRCLSQFPHLQLLPFLVLPEGHMDLAHLCKPLKFGNESPDFKQKVVQYLPTALRKGKCDFIATFLGVYPAFATTWKVLELIRNIIV